MPEEIKVREGFPPLTAPQTRYLRALAEAYWLAPVDGWAEVRLLAVLEEEANRYGVSRMALLDALPDADAGAAEDEE